MASSVVGIDVGKTTVVTAIWEAGAGRVVGTFPNTPAGWETLAATGPAEAPTLMVVAPTGGYELALIAWATQWGWRVSRPNPKHESFG